MRLKLIAPAAVAALTLSACGAAGTSGQKFSGAQGDVAKVISDLQSAGQRRDAKKICTDILATQTTKRLQAQGIDCATELGKFVNEASSFSLTVKSVKIEGKQAVARVSSKNGTKDQIDTVTLVNESGKWRVLSIGAPA
jgi:hypothetical protein